MSSTFLEHELGNYQDCIVNTVYNLQKYSDEFMLLLPKSIEQLRAYEYDSDFIGFLICEQEEILRDKILKTCVDICKVVLAKHLRIQEKIEKTNEGTRFLISKKSILYFSNMLHSINWIELESVHYQTDDGVIQSGVNPVYNFMKFMDDQSKQLETSNFGHALEETTKVELLAALKPVSITFFESMNRLKSLVENSNSCYDSAIYIRHMIKFMIEAYICVSFIDVIQ